MIIIPQPINNNAISYLEIFITPIFIKENFRKRCR
jgi:hypothetical protein